MDARTENGVGGVHCDLVLGGLADEGLGVDEGDVRGQRCLRHALS